MRLNKRKYEECANQGMGFDLESGVFHANATKHVVRAEIKNIGGRRTLAVYFYNRQMVLAGHRKPEYTLFQLKDGYITLHKTDGDKVTWRESSLENLGEGYIRFISTCAFYRLSDERLVTRFCNIPDKSGFDALNALQSAIMSVRLRKKVIRREKRILERMKPVKAPPRGFISWIYREVLPHYIFYTYRRDNKPRQGYCTACRKDVLVDGAKHNGEGACPNCGEKITFKSVGKSKRVWDRAAVQVMQRIDDNELLIRVYKVYNDIEDYRQPKFSIWESTRIFVSANEAKEMIAEFYYYNSSRGTLTQWVKGIRPRYSYYQYSFDCDLCGHLYCKNVTNLLKGTPWQYSQLERFCIIDREPMAVLSYLRAYNKYPAIEYLVKLGLTNLASSIVYSQLYGNEVINTNGKSLMETIGVGKKDLPVLQKINASKSQLELYQNLKRKGLIADESLLLWYQRHEITLTENVSIPLIYTTQAKLMRYIDGQFEKHKKLNTQYGRRYENVNRVLSDYKDYLNMGGMLNYNFKDSFVLFPRNLPEAHDQASSMYDVKKSEVFNDLIRNAYEALMEKYCFSKDGLTLIPPTTADEIVKEGHTLHHCVGSYVEKVAKGTCVILFIRQTDNITEPFYTLEIRDSRVIQIQGKDHCQPTKEVNKFLTLWERKKLHTAV